MPAVNNSQNNKGLTQSFIEGLTKLVSEPVSDDTRLLIKRLLLDYTGVTFAGAKYLANQHKAFLDLAGSESGKSTVLGLGKKIPARTAALLNAMSAHALDLDDGVRFGNYHPGVAVFSAALALCQRHKDLIDSNRFYKAVLVGYEASIRLAIALQPGHKLNGFHATGTIGTVGAAFTSTYLISGNPALFSHTLSAALTSSSGLLKVIRNESELKPYNAGQAAQNGIAAAEIACSGYKGHSEILDGDEGYLGMISSQYDDKIIKDFSEGSRYISKTYIKQYASCRHCHPAVEAVLKLREAHNISVDKIEKITIHTYSLALKRHKHNGSESVVSARLSTPYNVALALISGKNDIAAVTAYAPDDEQIQRLVSKITMLRSESFDALVPDKRPAEVEIQLQNGEKLTERVDLAKGEPECFLTDSELFQKFEVLCNYSGLTSDQSAELRTSVMNLDIDLSKFLDFISSIRYVPFESQDYKLPLV